MKRWRSVIAAAALTVLAVGPGLAQTSMLCAAGKLDLSEADASRLDNLFTSRTRGFAAAMQSQSREDLEIVSRLFESGLAPVDEDLLAGDYDCRTIKMGGNLPLVVYSWFSCEIVAEDAAYVIRKVTGSQNFFGKLQPQDDLYAYRGASSYGYETVVRFYGEDPERNQVGCLSAVTKGNRHFILELPFPLVESFHDVIELRPAN